MNSFLKKEFIIYLPFLKLNIVRRKLAEFEIMMFIQLFPFSNAVRDIYSYNSNSDSRVHWLSSKKSQVYYLNG
jgi:hypothetical protein